MGEVVRACGGPTAEECLIVHGGPAGGEVIDDPDTPVGKGTGDLLVLPAGHELVGRLRLPLAAMLRRGRAVCGGCGLCAGLCPARRIGRGIEPHRILRQVAGGSAVPAAVVRGALLCARCGLCALYACPHGLSPRLLHDAIRRGLEAQGVAPEGMVREPPAVSSAGAADAGAGAWTAAVPVGVPRDRLIDRLGLRRYVPACWADGRKTDPDRVELLLADLGPAGRSGGRLRVREGERVRAGQPLAAAPGAVALHASIDGRVVRVDDERIVIGR
jgi:Na+-translocating ferredoxin:NAD+ oxidoreductase RnfC subunit